MARICEICGKGRVFGKKVSHSMRKTPRSWAPNLRRIKIDNEGTPTRISICTSCLKRLSFERD